MVSPRTGPVRWDRQIQQRLLRGEESALGELYDQFAPLVLTLADRVLGDHDEAESLTREVFAHVWENPDAFDPDVGTMRSWIHSLTHRHAVERKRRLTSRRDPEPAPDLATEPSSVEEAMQAAVTAERVKQIVSQLPRPVRETIEMTYYDGRTYTQAAKELGIRPDDARHRLRLGLQLLASSLATAPSPRPPRQGAHPGVAPPRRTPGDPGPAGPLR
ncbi:RNA polymerase sigma factor [Allostreptomyces psammosilenae]|uniref:RNA polymerase sigma-70 factor (ECF subfamily) n=1 Tax=Allostreptomyces psammosilenae TaxID=1892865 RepID=A0A853A028_9ACTN|nr:sigma-70 family RNA polymerase sigma factor [Allostreptomyces psammosilenae]NYI07749.1 RNA polymerase sigma-70 factor (ECF subfamily) [Allostreptomyces psammosilenae]